MAKRKRRDITIEYRGAPLPDARLNSRLVQIAAAVEAQPDAGFPQVFATEAELEAFYRFVRNDRVSWEQVLDPHMEQTLRRVSSHETILVAHDTTEFRFGGSKDRDGLTRGRSGSQGEPGPRAKQGFFGHFALAVTADGHRHPLGVLGLYPWARESDTPTRRNREKGEPRDPSAPSEQDRWGKLVDEVEVRLGDVANAIHVLDSEADDYRLFAQQLAGSRFVVRLCYDRIIEETPDNGEKTKIGTLVAKLPVAFTNEVRVSKKTGRGRRKRDRSCGQRETTVEVSAVSVTLRRPKCAAKSLPKTITANLVSVREIDPPEGVEPVKWRLLTTEPIDSPEQINQVIDYYRGRWVIEEFFKAIKTGCAYQKRQLESLENLLVALAIFVPVAWQLLNLRTMSRSMPKEAASCCFSKRQLTVLRLASKNKLAEAPTVGDALLALARLGGHLKRNGPPGWQTLGRGFLELLALERGFILASEM